MLILDSNIEKAKEVGKRILSMKAGLDCSFSNLIFHFK